MKKLLVILLCLLLICPAQAEDTQILQDIILTHKLQSAGVDSVQAWIDGELTQNAGITAEWYVMALLQQGEYDFSAYCQSLIAYLDANTVRSKVSLQKYALALFAASGDTAYADEILSATIGQQGIMSWVYGLHLLNNGCESASVTVDAAIEALLSLQLADGGWVLSGTAADVDVTAMAVQALAPHYAKKQSVKEAIDAAVALLSSLQKADGGFASYGKDNPESAAQVWVALSALGIDALQDARFIKNGHTLLNAITSYQLADGTFSHEKGGASNHTATVQLFFALGAYQKMLRDEGSIYLFPQGTQLLTAPKTLLSYKTIANLAIGLLAILSCIILLVLKKRSWKNYVAVLLVAALLIVFVTTVELQSTDDYYSHSAVKSDPVGSVTMTIRCDTVAGKATHIPENGIILSDAVFDLAKGETAYDILIEGARAYGIHVESSGASGLRYVVGINQLYEYDFGELSGWMYFVNEQSPSVGCDQYTLQDGDHIEWVYTCALGADLK